MTYKEKLEELVKDFNAILHDSFLLPNNAKKSVSFDLVDEDGINLIFTDGDEKHIIYNKNKSVYRYNGEEDYQHAYWNILRTALLSEDAVNRLKDPQTGMVVNFLSFKTLFNSGLDKLKNK